MSDNITLPREVVKEAADALEDFVYHGESEGWWQVVEALRTALAAEQPKHPGYVIGSHWLETAYSRICAGEAEADVLRDCGWERVDEALRRDAERYRLLRRGQRWSVINGIGDALRAEELDALFDAAMEEDKT